MSLFKKLLKRSISEFFQKWKKWLIAFFVFIMSLFFLNHLTNKYVDRVVGSIIMEFVVNKSSGFYHVEYDELRFIVNSGRFRMIGFRFDIHPDHQKNLNLRDLPQNYLYQADIPILNIHIADLWSVFVQKKLRVKGIEIIAPSIKITNLNKNKTPKKISFEAGTMYKALSEHLLELKINDFEIVDGTFDYETSDGPDYDNFRINGLSFSVENFLLNNAAAQQDGKFFYTDDISLEIRDQVLLLKDSIHKVQFDEFYISTRENKLGFKNFRLTRRENMLADMHLRDHYEISLPELRFTGIDFLSAYNDNFLFIDSIHIDQPVFDLVRRNINQPQDSAKNNLLDLLMIYHDYLEINHFIVNDASLKISDETRSQPTKYFIDHIGAAITEVKIDQVTRTLRPYGIDFNHVNLVIKDYEMLLPDSLTTIRFAEFSISSDPDLIILKDLLIQPKPGHETDTMEQKILANMPYLVIKGFDIVNFINHDTILVNELYIEKPEVEVVSSNSRDKNDTPLAPADFFGLFKKINSFSRLFQIDRINVDDGIFSISNPEQNFLLQLNKMKIGLTDLKIDSITTNESIFSEGTGITLSTETNRIQTNDLALDAGKIFYVSASRRMKISDFHLLTNTLDRDNQSEFIFSEIGISGVNLTEILLQHKFLIDSLRISNGQTLLNLHTRGPVENTTKPENKTTFPVISVQNLVLDNTAVEVKSKDETLFKVGNIAIDISGFSLDQSLSDELKNQFDFGSINKISATDYTMLLTRQEHLLEIETLELINNSVISIENIRLLPVGKPDNEYRIEVPGIQMTHMNLKKILKESQYEGREIVINKPDITLRLSPGQQKKLTSLDLGFIPILLRNNFLGARADTLAIVDGSIHLHQKTSDDSLKLECDRFDLSIHNFSIDSTTEMVEGRFLFSNDVRLSGDYLSAYWPVKSNFYNVNHFTVSTNEQDIQLEGVYAATNIKNKIDSTGQLKLAVDYLEVLNLNFFKLTQRRMLDLSQIKIDNAQLNYSPSAGKAKSADDSKSNKSFLRDSPFPEKSSQMIENLNLFEKKSISSTPTAPRTKTYELNYLFDTMLLKSVRIDQILITDSRANLENAIENKIDLALPDIWFMAEGISYNPATVHDSSRIFYSDRIMTRLSNLNYVMPDNMNAIKINELVINSQDSTIKVKNFQLNPLVSKYDYGVLKGYQSTWMKLENDSIVLRDVDFLAIINNKTLKASKIDFHKLNFEIYRDKRVPFPEWQRRPLPQVELKNVDFTFNIDTIHLNNSYIGYLEHAEKSNAAGEVFFNGLNASVINFTNDPLRLVSYPKTNISASALVFGKGKVTAQFQFDMLNPENIHTYGVEVDSLDLTEFNRILIPNASAQVRSGINHRIIMTAKANEQYSYGEMRFYYNDLKVQLLNPDTEMPGGLGNVLGSFFANTFIIRTNNPRNFVLRKGDIFYERDKKRAIFNYWTKTFLSGVVSSIGASNNKKKIEKMHEEYLKGLEQKNSEEITLHD
jgi:hypothetical protein